MSFTVFLPPLDRTLSYAVYSLYLYFCVVKSTSCRSGGTEIDSAYLSDSMRRRYTSLCV